MEMGTFFLSAAQRMEPSQQSTSYCEHSRWIDHVVEPNFLYCSYVVSPFTSQNTKQQGAHSMASQLASIQHRAHHLLLNARRPPLPPLDIIDPRKNCRHDASPRSYTSRRRITAPKKTSSSSSSPSVIVIVIVIATRCSYHRRRPSSSRSSSSRRRRILTPRR